MSDLENKIALTEAKAHQLKEKRKYLEALKKFDELIQMQKEMYGDRSESVLKSS
jgi:hypothetical protein